MTRAAETFKGLAVAFPPWTEPSGLRPSPDTGCSIAKVLISPSGRVLRSLSRPASLCNIYPGLHRLKLARGE